MGHIGLPGSPDITCQTVALEEAFVSLRISENWHSDERFNSKKFEERDVMLERRHLSPEQVMERAFGRHRLLLIIGDPGSGKTTLMKYYVMSCLDKKNKKYGDFGFNEEIMPFYFPLRELEFESKSNGIEMPVSLAQNLKNWGDNRELNIPRERFQSWLKDKKTLVILDGLDEIHSKEQRKRVCEWIKHIHNGLKNAFFVVTSRGTGYRKLDNIELVIPHLRADIMDFSLEQQKDFLKKWFKAIYCAELPPQENQSKDQSISGEEWQRKKTREAERRSQEIINFLSDKENKTVQELVVVPLLLEIMAIIWKDHQFKISTRIELYDSALSYLLDYRERYKGLNPLLTKDESRRMLAPIALWMQEELKKDEAQKDQFHNQMQPHLNTLPKQHQAKKICEDHFRDRAGVIADYDKNHYVFRHKSFREFLSGLQLREDAHKKNRIKSIVLHFKEPWWEETLKFFFSKSNAEIFDQFMDYFFQSEVSRHLDDNKQTLLQNLIKEAPQRKIDALKKHLNNPGLNNDQKRNILDCLKTIGSNEVKEALQGFIKKDSDSKVVLDYARDIKAGLLGTEIAKIKSVSLGESGERGDSFRNPLEDNVEYIKIPGGSYTFSVTGNMETVEDFYLCKYPVTNKQYRRFIDYLAEEETELIKKLPLKLFAEKLLKFGKDIDGYIKLLEKQPIEWSNQLRSEFDEDKSFKAEDQPVVGVPRYACRAYCFWLSCLVQVIQNGDFLKDIPKLYQLYRLPTEIEWEWAAGGGESDGKIRKYPWPKEKGEPTPELANFGENVGSTTPVGRYPEGATPQGLMDLAGNVWEWMDNLYKISGTTRALRGGSWYNEADSLRCVSRNYLSPDGYWSDVGFRVLRSQSIDASEKVKK